MLSDDQDPARLPNDASHVWERCSIPTDERASTVAAPTQDSRKRDQRAGNSPGKPARDAARANPRQRRDDGRAAPIREGEGVGLSIWLA
jgi:hypothetical protein